MNILFRKHVVPVGSPRSVMKSLVFVLGLFGNFALSLKPFQVRCDGDRPCGR